MADTHQPDRVEVLRDVDLRALLEELAAPRGLHRRGRMFPCPSTKHGQTGRSPPVSVSTTADGYDLLRCHGCGEGGTAVDALLAAGQARDVAEAFAQLRDERYIELTPDVRRPPPAPPVTPEQVEERRRALRVFVDHCHRRLGWQEAEQARQQLHARGLTDAEMAAHRIGYDPGYHRLGREYQTFPAPASSAIMLPLFDEQGEVVYAQARLLEVPEDRSKYLNPHSDWIGQSPRVGRIHSPDMADRSVLVVSEGICDGIVAGRFFETRALIGAAQPDEGVADRLIKAADGRPVVVCFDSDTSGRTGAAKLVGLLTKQGGRAAAIQLPANDITATLQATGERFEAMFCGLVDEARERLQGEQSRARGDPLDRYRHLLGFDAPSG